VENEKLWAHFLNRVTKHLMKKSLRTRFSIT
jgi:hypothetical protein